MHLDPDERFSDPDKDIDFFKESIIQTINARMTKIRSTHDISYQASSDIISILETISSLLCTYPHLSINDTKSHLGKVSMFLLGCI